MIGRHHLLDWRRLLGAALGLGLFAAILAAVHERRMPSPPDALPAQGALLADCEGALAEVVVHYTPESRAITVRTYREFFTALPSDVRVTVVCPDKAAFAGLTAALGPTPGRLTPVYTGYAITPWSRDRWLALPPAQPGGSTLLLRPHSENGAPVWPARAGDYRTAEALARARPAHVTAGRCRLYFDGGDFVADAETVFVTPAVRRRNADCTDDEVRTVLERFLDKTVVLLPDAPRHHAGMFMMPVGNRTVLVGNPADGRDLLTPGLLAAPDFSAATQERFDAVAAACREHGYRVVRVPVVPDRDERTYLSYVNVILDVRAGEHTVYMPVFRGADRLNRAATRVWADLGWRVCPVDCSGNYRHFGTLRCLVNVLARR